MSRFHTHEWDLLPEHAFKPRGWKQPMTLEGGKGSDAPAPDPELIKAQIRSMGIQDSAINQIISNSNAMLPLQREQMQFGLDTSRAAYDQSQQDRSWMLDRRGSLTGLQNQLVADAKTFNSDDRRNQLASEAMGDVSQVFAGQRQQAQRGLARTGINPASGAYAGVSNQMDMAEATAKATAANKTRQAARLEGMAMTDRATNALAGYPAMGMQATGNGANFGAAGLGLANQGLAGMNAGFGAGSNAAGQLGSNATGMWGAQASYKNQQDQIANAADPFASLLGAGATLGAAWLGSDRRLKQDITAVGTDERTGLTLYEFSYIDGSGQRYRGVMADEVERVAPAAVYVMPDGYKAVNYTMLGIDMVKVDEVTA